MEKILNKVQLDLLRSKGIITPEEIAFMTGDLFVAEDIVTRKRRVISEAKAVLTESKQLLKG